MSVNKTILVIDDDWLNHEVLESVLGVAGYTVLQARRGSEGLNMATSNLPDLVLADVNLPDLNGFVLCEQLKRDPQTTHIPVILITGHIQGNVQRQKAKTAGAYDFVERVVKPTILLERISDALSGKSLNNSGSGA